MDPKLKLMVIFTLKLVLYYSILCDLTRVRTRGVGLLELFLEVLLSKGVMSKC